jgi:putative transposase
MKIIGKDIDYLSNNTTVHKCIYHIIWTTKYRRSVLTDEMQKYLKKLLLNYSNENEEFNILELEIMGDHVHCLIQIDPDFPISSTLNILKGSSSHDMNEHFPELKKKLPTLWTRSKFVASVGSVSLETVKKYIENQKNK